MIAVRIQTAAIDINAEMAALRGTARNVGAIVSFTGLMREFDGATRLDALTLEHYPAMAEREFEAIAAEAALRWPLLGGAIIHRIGRILPAESIVLVLTASEHRQPAFEAAQYLMDWLKSRAPIWKRAESATGASWVDAKETDTAAVDRWRRMD